MSTLQCMEKLQADTYQKEKQKSELIDNNIVALQVQPVHTLS